jgi:hypothetical protein
MTLRIVCREDDAGMAANVGGSVLTTLKTFDIEHPELEAWLREQHAPGMKYWHRQIVGVEIVPDSRKDTQP